MVTSKLTPEDLKKYELYPCELSYKVEEAPYCSTFLEFARKDLENSREMRNIGNAVSNAKKAMHRRVERLCEVLGYDLNANNKSNFPSKLKYLSKCGLITPRILYRLNTIRNKIEHDYITISYEEAEDFVDIIELFLVATGLFLKNYPKVIDGTLTTNDTYLVKNKDSLDLPKSIEFTLKLQLGKIELRICESNGEQLEIDISDENYFKWLNFLFSSYFSNY